MWPATKKVDQGAQKDALFNELYFECRQAAPGARLSYRLQSKLEKLEPHERKEIVSKTKHGCSPLFVSCKRGNEDIVKYLVTSCSSDVEQRGLYEVPEDHSTHLVTPLWCASVAGHLGVVKWLVEHGSANVNSVSDTGSTPVRSACFMTHLKVVKCLVEHGADILKPNYNGGTCLINSVQSVPLCKFLLENGAEVNAQDIQLKTALHYAIQEHRFDTTKLLLEHGANPLTKSRCGDDALQTACLKGAAQIFDHLIETVRLYDAERIADANVLLGCTYLDDHHDLQTALLYWREAARIRETIGGDLPSQENVVLREAYQNAVEFRTRAELEELILDLDALRMQSLVVCERILGPTHKDTIFRVMYRGAAYADSLKYQRCIDLWLYALKLRIQKDGLLHGEVCFTAEALVRLFLDLLQKHGYGVLLEEIRYEDIEETIALLIEQFPIAVPLLQIRPIFKRQHDNFDRILGVLTHLLYIMLSIPKKSDQEAKVKRLVSSLVRFNPQSSAGDTLLHLSVSRSNDMKANTFFEDTNMSIFPSIDLVSALLDSGMEVNIVNHVRDTPLHVATAPSNCNLEVVRVLLQYGAHVDQKNTAGEKAYRLLERVEECYINPLNFLTLKCLSAQAVVRYGICYQNEVPTTLESFIQLH